MMKIGMGKNYLAHVTILAKIEEDFACLIKSYPALVLKANSAFKS